MKQHGWKFWVGSFLILCVGCSLSGPLREDAKAEAFNFKEPKVSWKPMNEKADADYALIHNRTGASMALRSLCNRYEHINLNTLNQNVLSLLNNPEVLSQEEITLDDRMALDTRFSGDLDGVPVEMRHVVLKKDHCIFDFTLTQVDKISEEQMKDFSAFIKSFHFNGARLNP